MMTKRTLKHIGISFVIVMVLIAIASLIESQYGEGLLLWMVLGMAILAASYGLYARWWIE